MAMTVGELIQQLKCYDLATEVRMAYQPNYPLQCHIDGVKAFSEIEGYDDDKCYCKCADANCSEDCDCGGDCNKSEEDTPEYPDILFILQGNAPRHGDGPNDTGYANRKLWD